ncbi:nuclear transport factor 2 family protein [Streptomyces hyaluromycini]|uniref:Nuclear transport factor 2 family protein n=1 Tax=Streptomyces hyaluromycini TaxID=1377993 RepID=A0ABV1X297_9ACTN
MPSPVPVWLTEGAVVRLAEEWFAALDRRAPVDELLPLLVPSGLVLHFPEGVYREREGFRVWYEAAHRRLGTGAHAVTAIDVRLNDGPSAEVGLTVDWQGSRRDALGRRRRTAHETRQIWTVAQQGGNTPQIRTCSVTGLTAMLHTLAR